MLRILADQLFIPLCTRHQHGILVTPSDIATLLTNMPQVVIFHRTLSLKNIRRLPYVPNNLLSLSRRLYFDLLVPLSVKKAVAIVSPSKFWYEMLVSEHPEAESKAYVIHDGVSH